MPNIGQVLKAEISRLARREVVASTTSTRRMSAQYRKSIAELKRQVAMLTKTVAYMQRQRSKETPLATEAESQHSVRFMAKGLASHRSRLGVSAAEYGRLLGVSSQSVYNWERGKSSPRATQLQRIVEIRKLGKRQVRAALGERPKRGRRAG